MSEEEADKIIENYFKAKLYLDCLGYLISNRIPFEDWPTEYQPLAYISEAKIGEKK